MYTFILNNKSTIRSLSSSHVGDVVSRTTVLSSLMPYYLLYATLPLCSLTILLFQQHAEIAELRQECVELRNQNANLERMVKDSALVCSCSFSFLCGGPVSAINTFILSFLSSPWTHFQGDTLALHPVVMS